MNEFLIEYRDGNGYARNCRWNAKRAFDAIKEFMAIHDNCKIIRATNMKDFK